MNKKYELLTTDTIHHCGQTLYRIRALVQVHLHVKVGDLGGYIESERNLDITGASWVGDKAKVFGNARISGNASVFGNACISGNANVFSNASVFGNACISGNVSVFDSASISGDACTYGNAHVFGNAHVYGSAQVYGRAYVYGNACISGNVSVFDSASISGNAEIAKSSDILWYSRVGSENGTLAAYRTAGGEIELTRGCFSGTIDEFLAAVELKHGNTKIGRNYVNLVHVIRDWFDTQDEVNIVPIKKEEA